MLDKKIIVTGGSYGIGAHLVAALVAEGANVSSLARSVELGERNAAELAAKGPGMVRFYQCDVSDRMQVKSAFAAAVGEMGGLDGLLHVAGVEGGAAAEIETDENWQRMMAINAGGTFICNQEAFPYLRKAGGRILNFGSGAGITGLATAPAYSASKAAILGWSRSAAAAWGPYGVTVNVVCPMVMTPMYAQYRSRITPEQLQTHDANMQQIIHIGGEMGDVDRDLVPVMLFYLSDGARFVTGQLINVDGGALMSR